MSQLQEFQNWVEDAVEVSTLVKMDGLTAKRISALRIETTAWKKKLVEPKFGNIREQLARMEIVLKKFDVSEFEYADASSSLTGAIGRVAVALSLHKM